MVIDMKREDIKERLDWELMEVRTDKQKGKQAIHQWHGQLHTEQTEERGGERRVSGKGKLSYGRWIAVGTVATALLIVCVLLSDNASVVAKVTQWKYQLSQFLGIDDRQESAYEDYIQAAKETKTTDPGEGKKQSLASASVAGTKVDVVETIYTGNVFMAMVKVTSPKFSLNKKYKFRDQRFFFQEKKKKQEDSLGIYSYSSQLLEKKGKEAVYLYSVDLGKEISELSEITMELTDFGKMSLKEETDEKGFVEDYQNLTEGTWELNWEVAYDKQGTVVPVDQKITVDYDETGVYPWEIWNLDQVILTPFSMECVVSPTAKDDFMGEYGVVFGEFVEGIIRKDGSVLSLRENSKKNIQAVFCDTQEDDKKGREIIVFRKAQDIGDIQGIVVNGQKIYFS